MTEAETFNALKRIPFKQMYDLWQDAGRPRASAEFYEQHGWTYAEFWDEYYKRQHD
jgi:hypothetical protein